MNLKSIGKAAVMAMALPFATLAGNNEQALKLNAEGVRLLQKGDAEGAVRTFKAALDADSGCVEAANNIVKILVANKRYGAAEVVLKKALEASPNQIGCLIPMAQVKALQGKSEECLDVLKTINASDNRTELPSLALLLMAQGASKEAMAAIDMAIAVDEKNAANWFKKGIISEHDKDWTSAEASYSKAVVLQDNYADAWINLGNVRLNQKKTADAIKCYEKAFALAPSSSLAQYNLARMLIISRSDVKRGLTMLDAACKGTGEGARMARTFRAQLADLVKKGGAK